MYLGGKQTLVVKKGFSQITFVRFSQHRFQITMEEENNRCTVVMDMALNIEQAKKLFDILKKEIYGN